MVKGVGKAWPAPTTQKRRLKILKVKKPHSGKTRDRNHPAGLIYGVGTRCPAFSHCLDLKILNSAALVVISGGFVRFARYY